MKPGEFTYHRPRTLAEALELYANSADARILAGGQSLIPLMSMRLATPQAIIDINQIEELATISANDQGVRFGGIVRHSELLNSTTVGAIQPLIPHTLAHVANPTIRNRGTTVGSIVHADAAGEMPMVFALLGGKLTAQSVRGQRTIGADDLFIGALDTSLAQDEIATEVFLPALAPGHGVAFEEVARRTGDYALCAVGALVGVDSQGAITTVKTGYVSVADIPVVVNHTECFPNGECSPENLEASGENALQFLDPTSDVHASARYRQHLVKVLTQRAIQAAYDHAVKANEKGGS